MAMCCLTLSKEVGYISTCDTVLNVIRNGFISNAVVSRRARYGDWEIDTVIGQHGTGVIVTALERNSRFYVTKKVTSKNASEVATAPVAKE